VAAQRSPAGLRVVIVDPNRRHWILEAAREIDSTRVLSSSLYLPLTSCDVNFVEATQGFRTRTQFQCITKNYITDLGSFCTSKRKAVRCFQNGVYAEHVTPLICPQPTSRTKHTKPCGAVQDGYMTVKCRNIGQLS